MRVRIFRQPKTAMQSGRAGTHVWALEWEATERRQHDPMMGWPGSSDTQTQVKLRFDSCEEAIAYAERTGLDYAVELPPPEVSRPKSYADNFRVSRETNWTH